MVCQKITEINSRPSQNAGRFSAFFVFSLFALVVMSFGAKGQPATTKVVVPDWALPGSATHKQVPPPPDFHRTTRTTLKPIGLFEGQSDVGAALVPGSSGYDAATKQYTITSAGYNVWYTRDEFRYIWKKMSGDFALSADVNFPDTAGYDDRKAFVIIRQSLDDDAKEMLVALHGGGLLHQAWRPEKGKMMEEVRANHRKNSPDLVTGKITRIGLSKTGDAFALLVGTDGGPDHAVGEPVKLSFDGPFYVGLGFCSHLPDKADSAVLSRLTLTGGGL